jgi:hypothetical protein
MNTKQNMAFFAGEGKQNKEKQEPFLPVFRIGLLS